MLDWLKRRTDETPMLALGERQLPVVVRRLAHARRMTLRLAPDGSEVRISIPRWGHTAEALAFAESRRDWLARQLGAVPPQPVLAHGAQLPLRGIALTIAHDPRAPRTPAIVDETIRLGGPVESVPARVRRWLEREARTVLADDLAHYCARAGQRTPALSLSNARRRWGSCAADG
ncbi:MAG: YgjP-like metallopeptidase domain-containing protein, partial [Novosphingobium sp.]